MIHELIPEVIEQGYGKEKESLHVGGFIGALLGFKTGLVDDLPRNLCRDVLELLFDPLGTVCDIVDSIMPNNPDNCVAQIMRAWQSGDDFSRGRIVGNITGQVAIIVASKKFSAKVASGRALEAAGAASEVGSAAGVAEAASEAAAVAKEAQSAARVAKSAEAASKVASVAKEVQSAAKVAKGAEVVAKSTAGVAKEAETVAKSAAVAAKSAETVAKGTKAASGASTVAKEAKSTAETAKNAKAVVGETSAAREAATVTKTETVVESANKSSSVSGKVWDYSRQFEGELTNFNNGYKIRNVVDKDLYLVQFHSDAEVGSGRSLKYWTTFDEANGISTIDGYMNKMALMSNWGARDNVSIAKVPAGTKIRYAIGTAKEQVGAIESRPGGGLQILFEQFDSSWIIETRHLQ